MFLFIADKSLSYNGISFLLVIITPLYTYTTICYIDTLTMILPILSLLNV